MLRRLQAFLVSGLWLAAMPAAAQDTEAEPTSDDQQPPSAAAEPAAAQESAAASEEPATPTEGTGPDIAEGSAAEASSQTPTAEEQEELLRDAPTTEVKPVEKRSGWETFASGYFRAPLAIGVSTRPGPDNMNGPSETQLSYGPNRTVDANYYSFAYTRLQEQDWAEVFLHAKHDHVEAVVGWMGYWFQGVGFRNNDAAWTPGMAYVVLDTDFDVAGIKPNVALTAGAWWPKFGYFAKYDTYTLGQIRQLGEQLKLTIPLNPDLQLTLIQGFGSGRDGSSNILAPPPYQATVGLNLIHYEHIQLTYKKLLDVAFHFNHQWTRDPNLTQQTVPGRAYADAKKAKFTNVGGEATVSLPVAGRLWVSPSYTRIRNGWALGEAGIELMHSLSGEGYATNYLAWNSSPANSTGTGSSFNLGFLYENSLSNVLGKAPGQLPDVTLNVFGLLIDAKLDLPAGSVLKQDRIAQFKYGADLNLQVFDWLGFMVRWDEVNYDLDNSGYVFNSITPRITFSSHFLAGESIYLQYSRYTYGDRMVLAGKWPWGLPLVAGNDIIQGGPYSGDKPDMDVLRVQASVAF